MVARRHVRVEPVPEPLPALRFKIGEAALILRMSRAKLYTRIQEGSIKPQKDGARTYITRPELERYVESCNASHDHPASRLAQAARCQPSLRAPENSTRRK
jgi:hypothetical protein